MNKKQAFTEEFQAVKTFLSQAKVQSRKRTYKWKAKNFKEFKDGTLEEWMVFKKDRSSRKYDYS